MEERVIYQILSVVEEIPAGCVATYGQIARLVGRVLSQAERYGAYPCHRVVNHCGRLVPGWEAQRFLLEDEGVAFRDETHVDLRRCLWEP